MLIEHFKTISRSEDAVRLMLWSWQELIDTDCCEVTGLPEGANVECLLARTEGTAEPHGCGLLSFWHFPDRGLIWIYNSYVTPRHRRRGVYKALYQRLREIAASRGCTKIESGISKRNKVMLKAAAATGRKVVGHVTYREELDPASISYPHVGGPE